MYKNEKVAAFFRKWAHYFDPNSPGGPSEDFIMGTNRDLSLRGTSSPNFGNSSHSVKRNYADPLAEGV